MCNLFKRSLITSNIFDLDTGWETEKSLIYHREKSNAVIDQTMSITNWLFSAQNWLVNRNIFKIKYLFSEIYLGQILLLFIINLTNSVQTAMDVTRLSCRLCRQKHHILLVRVLYLSWIYLYPTMCVVRFLN